MSVHRASPTWVLCSHTKDVLVAAAERSGDEDAARAVRGLPLAEYGNYDEVLRSVSTPGG